MSLKLRSNKQIPILKIQVQRLRKYWIEWEKHKTQLIQAKCLPNKKSLLKRVWIKRNVWVCSKGCLWSTEKSIEPNSRSFRKRELRFQGTIRKWRESWDRLTMKRRKTVTWCRREWKVSIRWKLWMRRLDIGVRRIEAFRLRFLCKRGRILCSLLSFLITLLMWENCHRLKRMLYIELPVSLDLKFLNFN